MTLYRVEVEGRAREVYYVEADSPEDAADNWHTGQLDFTEVYDCGPERVEEAEQ